MFLCLKRSGMAADEQDEMLSRAKEVILLMAEEVMADEHMLSIFRYRFC